METRVDRPDLGLYFYTTTSFAHHFWHCLCVTVVFSLHRLSDPVENHSNELSVVPFLVAYPFGTPHGFKFFWLEVQLSSLALGPWGLSFGYCKLGGATFGVAFLSIIFSIKVVWTSLEVRLIILSKEEKKNTVNISYI